MTQDELRAALLLLGFRTGPASALLHVIRGKRVLVRFNTQPNKVGVSYREAGKSDSWRDFNTTPESVLNFIKKRFL